MNPAEEYIFRQEEPYQSILIHVRSVILSTVNPIEEKFNYSVPFYHYRKKPFIYLNILKGQDFVDVAFVKGVRLEDRFPQLMDYNERKNVRSLQYKSLEDIDENLLREIILAAAELTGKSRTGWFN
ncbi:MAG: DUF1801 domain-containing protein [Flavobacteriaceae bacterium]|nr:DUF1801 domain-containing protein [Bacteroidia bacterium]NNK88376.1 DUF1801 domain-containing protein [Flavobacteriaceae bacterium]